MSKTIFSGTTITYGADLPAPSTQADGTLFVKTAAPNEGLYLYAYVPDTQPALFGQQGAQQWTQLVSLSTAGVYASLASNNAFSGIQNVGGFGGIGGVQISPSSTTSPGTIDFTNGSGISQGMLGWDGTQLILGGQWYFDTPPIIAGGAQYASLSLDNELEGVQDVGGFGSVGGVRTTPSSTTAPGKIDFTNSTGTPIGGLGWDGTQLAFNGQWHFSTAPTFGGTPLYALLGSANTFTSSQTVGLTGGVGGVRIVPSTNTFPGKIEFLNSAGVDTGAIGWDGTRLEIGGEWYFDQNVTTSGHFIAGSAGNGSATLLSGDATHSGTVEFKSSAGVRQGLIGYSSTNAAQDLGTIIYIAFEHAFNGQIQATSLIRSRDTFGSGYVELHSGSTTNAGTIQFKRADGERHGYIGAGTTGAFATDDGSINHVAGQHNFTGVLSVRAQGVNQGRVDLRGGGSLNAGYVEFMSPFNLRQGYIGFSETNAPILDEGRINYVALGGHNFTGAIIANTGVVAVDGSSLLPAFRFSADTNCGIYRHSAETVGVSTNLFVNNTISTGSISVLSGSAGTPSIYFAGDTNCGIYRHTAEVVGINDSLFVNSDITSDQVITGILSLTNYATIPAGSAGAPSIRFTGDTNCGIYNHAADTVGVNTNLYANGDITAFSDIRVKDQIEVIPDALAKVEAIRGVTYIRTDLTSGKRYAGVIAQEVETVLPEVVVTHPEDGMKSVAYGNMVALLIEAVKELSTKVQVLQARVADLEG